MPGEFQPPRGAALARLCGIDCENPDRPVTIEGVVSPMGQGGWGGRPTDQFHFHTFYLAGWRRVGGSLCECPLYLTRPLPIPGAIIRIGDDYAPYFPDYSFQRFTVLLSKDERRATIEQKLPVGAPDVDLLAFIERHKQPVTMTDAEFGPLVLDRSVNSYEGSARWNGAPLSLSLITYEDSVADALAAAKTIWANEGTWMPKIVELIVQKLLPLKNDQCLGDDEQPWSAQQLLERVEFQSVTVQPDGTFEFYLDDGGAFGGDHLILVDGDLERGPSDATVAG